MRTTEPLGSETLVRRPCHRASTRLAVACSTLLIVLGGTSANAMSPESTAADPWTLLWTNQVDDAIRSFEGILDRDDKNLSARRGLSIALLAGGQERRAIESALELGKIDEAGALDFLLAHWIYANTLTHGKDEKEFQKLFTRLSERKAIDPLDRRLILATVGRFAISNGDRNRARKVAEDLHRIDRWSILGPFDNTSGSGRSKDHLGDRAIMSNRTYVGKAGQRFKWHNPKVLGLLQDIDFENHLARSEGITAYAGTRIIAQAPGTYILSVTRTGAMTIELDGVDLITLEDDARQTELYHFELDLSRGSHSLLFRVSGEENTPEIAAAISTMGGERAEDLSLSPLVPGTTEQREVSFRRRLLPLAAELQERAEADTTDPRAAYWWLVALAFFELDEEAREYAALAGRRFPDSAVLRYAIGIAFLTADDEDLWRAQMRKAFALDPNNATAANWKAQELIRRASYSQSDSLLQDLTRKYPDFLRAQVTLLNSYVERGLPEKAMALAERMIDRYPDYAIPYRVLAEHYEPIDPSRSRSYWKKAVDRSPRGMEILSLLQKAAEKDDLGKTIKQLKELYKLFPDGPILGTDLAMSELRNGDEDGLELIKELSAAFPYSYRAQYVRGAVAELMIPYSIVEKQVAIDHYRRALALRPGDFDTRDKLRSLTGLKPVSEILPPIDLGTSRSSAPDASDYPGQDACVLRDERRRILFADGSNHAERALLIKVFTDGGVQRFGTISTGVNPLFSDLTVREARTLKADGREIEAEQLLDKIAFRNLAPGDIIELRYTSSSWSVGKLNQEYWDSHLFQWGVPCLESRYALLVPKEKELQWQLQNHSAADSIMSSEERGDFILYTWEMKEIPPRDSEIHMPPPYDVSPWLDISTIEDWDRIAAWYDEISTEPSRVTPRVEEEVRKLLADDGADDGLDVVDPPGGRLSRQGQIRRLYDFVANQVAYEDLSFMYSAYIPKAAPDVLRAMYGDCKDKASLLRSMLRSVGVESYFALVTPVTSGRTSYLPSPRFTHAILAIPSQSGSRYWFLDPTMKAAPAAYVSESLQGARALLIRPGSAGLITIPYQGSELPFLTIETDVEVENEADLRLRRRQTIRTADEIASMRLRYAVASDEERRRQLLAGLGREYVGLELQDCQWTGLDVGPDTVGLSYEMRLREVVSKSGALRLVNLPWQSSVDERYSMVIASPTRKQPLLLYGLRLSEDERLRLALPQGWKIEGLPESRTFVCDFGTFGVEYAIEGSHLVARRQLRIAGEIVPPDRYAPFKRFLEDVIREQDLVLVFRVSG